MDSSPPTSDDSAGRAPPCLRAGPLSVVFEAGDLRHVRWGGREVIRRIYAAVRDHNWDTIPGEISNLETWSSSAGFRISYRSTHRRGEVHFVWRAGISGGEDGEIRFTFEGEALTTFLKSRIGFCVLHPIRECVGALCRARSADGTERELRFPEIIAVEQPMKWLQDLVGLAHEVVPGVWAELELSGDLFETEDQRSWIDASFKTYCTPLRLPYPVEIKAGTLVRQEVRLRLSGRSHTADRGASPVRDAPSPPPVGRGDSPAIVRVTGEVLPLPSVGLCQASHGQPLGAEEVRRLRALRPAHLRVDLRLWEDRWSHLLEQAAGEAALLESKLEVALHLDVSPEKGLAPAAAALARRHDALARVLVFHRDQITTTGAALQAAREAFGSVCPGVLLGAGTDADLYQLNLERPPPESDLICWSMNPQVHAQDDTSLVETPEGAAHQVKSVHSYFPGKKLVVSPVTLRPRFNPYATGPAPPVLPGELPPQVDPRQLSLLGAAWTLAMLKSIAESGAASLTFYETTGWRGVLETAAGSPLPARFPSIPGAVFPLYHVLADVCAFAGGEVLLTESGDPAAIASLLLRRGDRTRLLVANLGLEPREIALEGTGPLSLSRCLDDSTFLPAMSTPELFREGAPQAPVLRLRLGPRAVATLDLSRATPVFASRGS